MSLLTPVKYAEYLDARAQAIGLSTPEKKKEESVCPVDRLLDDRDYERLLTVIEVEEKVGKVFSSLLQKMTENSALALPWDSFPLSGQPRCIEQSTRELRDKGVERLYQLYLSLPKGSFGEVEHQHQARTLAEHTASTLAKPVITTMMASCTQSIFCESSYRDMKVTAAEGTIERCRGYQDMDVKIAEEMIKSRLGLSARLGPDKERRIVPLPSQRWKSDQRSLSPEIARQLEVNKKAEFMSNLFRLPLIRRIPIAAFPQRMREQDSCQSLRALDIGCGGSPLTYTLGRLGFTATAVDIEFLYGGVVQRDAAFLRKSGSEAAVTFKQSHILDFIKKSEDSFDCIFCLQFLYLLKLEEQWELLQQMIHVLAPGGLLYLNTVTLDTPPNQQGVTHFSWEASNGLTLCVSLKLILEALECQKHQIQAQEVFTFADASVSRGQVTAIAVLKKR